MDKPEKDNDHDDETATTIPGEDDDNRKLPPVDNRKRPPGEEEDDNRKLPPDDNRKLPPGDEDIKTLLPPSSDDQLNDKKLPPRGVKPEKPVTSSPDANTSSGVMETPSRPISNKLTKDPRSNTEIMSMSFADVVASPIRSRETMVEVVQRLKTAIAEYSDNLEQLAREVQPDIDSLPPQAMNFLMAIFGGDGVPPATHADADLESFLNIGTSYKFASLALHKMQNGLPQLRLRYFAGLGDNDKKDRSKPEMIADIRLAKGIRSFFTQVFNNPENTPIEDCVNHARSLYITAKTFVPRPGKPKNITPDQQASAAEALKQEVPPDETIVACLNFACMGNHGFWVNWLAVSNEVIASRKYGAALNLLTGVHGTWQRRNFAVFLLKVAHLSVLSHLRLMGEYSSSYCIALQARTASSENAPKFYTSVGFEEGDIVETDSQLSASVFEEFPTILRKAEDSPTDYIHFIWESNDICIFKNTTGTFGKSVAFLRRLRKNYLSVKFGEYDGEKSFSFPFAAIREHLMFLATNLELFFLPFRPKTDLNEFITPNQIFHNELTTHLIERDMGYIKDESGWLNDSLIDFYIRWYDIFGVLPPVAHQTSLSKVFLCCHFYSRLTMDGTTKATEFTMFLTCKDLEWWAPSDFDIIDQANAWSPVKNRHPSGKDPKVGIKEVPKQARERDVLFRSVSKTVEKMKNRGFFNKPWILIPLNMRCNQHWCFAGLLNANCLGQSQEEAFSGFFYYDSMHPEQTRLEQLTALHNKGILNMLVYANLVYGNPKITTTDIREMLFDPTRFAKIAVPTEDCVEQDDACNCGIFVWLNLLEMSMVHSRHYQHMKDFQRVLRDLPSLKALKESELEFHFQKGDFFKLYKPPKTTATLQEGYSHLSPLLFRTVRTQADCLFARILTLKNGKNFSPRWPTSNLPKTIQINFREQVWDIGVGNQVAINKFLEYTMLCTTQLQKLLVCKNPVITNSNNVFAGDEPEALVEDETTPRFSIEELEQAGMQEIVSLPGDDGDETPGTRRINTRAATARVENKGNKSTTRLRLKLPLRKNAPATTAPATATKTPEELQAASQGGSQFANEDLEPIAKALTPVKKDTTATTDPNAGKWKQAYRKNPAADFTESEKEIAKKYGKRKSEDYQAHQRDVKYARRRIAACADLPNTEKELSLINRKLLYGHSYKKIEERRLKAAQNTYAYHAFDEYKPLEAELHLWDSVSALQYVVVPGKPTTMGFFRVRLKRNGDVIPVLKDWVESQFEKDVVKACIASTEGSFIEVKKEVFLPVDNRQVRKLRYNVRTTAESGTFEGLLSDGTYTSLTSDYVEDNFDKEYITLVKEEGLQYQAKQFFHVPPGAPRTNDGHWMMNDCYPRLQYRQQSESTCLFSSFASALHYLHIEDSAKLVADLAHQFSAASKLGLFNWHALIELMQQNCGWLTPKKIKSKSFNVLNNISEYPTLLCLEATDGGTQHAITVVGGLIFDSNCEHALPLTMKSLNYCCSSDKREGHYKQVYHGYRFEEDYLKKNKNLDKLKKKYCIDFFTAHDDVDDDDDEQMNPSEI